MKIVSKKQAAFLGAMASGKGKKGGPKPEKARKMLAENRGFKMRDLPRKAKRQPSGRKPSR